MVKRVLSERSAHCFGFKSQYIHKNECTVCNCINVLCMNEKSIHLLRRLFSNYKSKHPIILRFIEQEKGEKILNYISQHELAMLSQ